MTKSQYVGIASCLALSAIMVIQLLREDVAGKYNTVVPVTEDSEPPVHVEQSHRIATNNPFQEKLEEQQRQYPKLIQPVLMNPIVGQDPFKAFLEKNHESVHQSPFSSP